MQNIFFIRKKYIYFLLLVISLLTSIASESRVSEPLSPKGKARKIDFLTLEIVLNRHCFNYFSYKTNNTTLLSPVGRVDFRSKATKRRERSYALKTF